MKRRWKILLALGIFLVVIGASLALKLHVLPAREVDAYKKFLRAKGEKLEINEVTPPPVAPGDNSVDAVKAAFDLIDSRYDKIPEVMRMVAPGKALIGHTQPDIRGWDFTNSWDEFAADVAMDRPAIELLHKVLDRPALSFQIDYKDPLKTLVITLAPMKRAAQKLEAAIIWDLHQGDCGAAATNILTSLALVQKNAEEGLEISHLVRVAMLAIDVGPTWELLQATNVTDVQLAAVQAGWQQVNLFKDAENAFVVERAWSSVEIEKTRKSHVGFTNTFGSISYSYPSGSGWSGMLDALTQGPRHAVSEAMWRSSWSYSDELESLKGNQLILETLRAMQTNQSQFYKADYDQMSSRFSSLGLTNTSNALLDFLRIPDLRELFEFGSEHALRGTLRLEAARRVVITAIALKRFQLKHGKWPEKLNELTPKFISCVPIDPYDGKPLKYHPNANGTFLLYSVAENGVDDGGDPTCPDNYPYPYWLNYKARDWVWPQPATPAEIQHFYEHPPR